MLARFAGQSTTNPHTGTELEKSSVLTGDVSGVPATFVPCVYENCDESFVVSDATGSKNPLGLNGKCATGVKVSSLATLNTGVRQSHSHEVFRVFGC
jgi:hypothetical protein